MNNKCIGCGINLQSIDVNKDGYVSSNDHRLCERCFKIKNYGQNKNVLTGNQDYIKILDNIQKDDLFTYIMKIYLDSKEK